MRAPAISLVMLTGLVAFGWLIHSTDAAEPANAKPAVNWQSDLKTAHQNSERTGRPMLIVFSAEWCTHCKRFAAETLGNPTMAEIVNRDFVPVMLDFDKDKRAARILEVKALPCTVILSPNADLLGRVVGAKPPKELWEVLQDAKDEQVRIRQARFMADQGNGQF